VTDRRRLDAGLDLLDRHVRDCDGASVGKVDDLELEFPTDGPPRVTALLLGPQAQGPRIGGHIGRWMAAIGAKLADSAEPYRIPVELVADFDVSIQLTVTRAELTGTQRLERWLHQNLIDRIPGGRRASG
jgi:sporulation protein YlmC with PRC-barrel domain